MRGRGVKGLTIAEIAANAHVGKGTHTAYLYWKTKEDLLLAVITTSREKTEDNDMTRTTETAIDRYIQIFDRAAHDPERSTSSARSSRRTPACSAPTTRSR